ncbi:hypothetical protein DFH11DRAFT_457780 [Phellopilus nigrolimitatus]|nr:hypothetical protein DFH11DRAFT_457780 [Phellopilus nigrolimitatus]
MPINIFPASGSSLPPFKSILIKGAYAPSAPIHLCVSHLQIAEDTSEKILFLTPNRQSFAASLQDFNDGWLAEHAVTGTTAKLLSKVDIYYPPSTAHWLLLLSLFKPLSNSTASTSRLAVLPYTPSLLVLHEPSAYFLVSDQADTLDLPRYLQLITTALATASFLSSRETIPVVLFDSRLGDLKLPIVRPLTPSRSLFGDDERSAIMRQERIERFVEKYFEWTGAVVDENDAQRAFYFFHLCELYFNSLHMNEAPRTPPGHGTFDASSKTRTGPFKLLMERRASGNELGSEQVVLEWSESKYTRSTNAAQPGTRFIIRGDN